MPTKTIQLQNGPYNGSSIADSGTVRIRMSLDGQVKGISGEAIYEPDETREHALWKGDVWDGTLEAVLE